MYDVLIVGGGPAGLSAALTLRRRNKSCAVVTGPAEDNPLYRAKALENYPGLPGVDGKTFLETLEAQARDAGTELFRGRVTAILPLGGSFGASAGQDVYEARAVILCAGANKTGAFPGERELLGRGVSYCVTCDGMLYRGRRVAVAGFTGEAEQEAQLLRDMGCTVELFTRRAGRYAVLGTERVEALSVDGVEHPCDAVFILRAASAPDTLLADLKMDGAHVAAGRDGATNIPGVFAAGDCTGTPYQAVKAVGEGNVAALSAAAWLEAGGGSKEVGDHR